MKIALMCDLHLAKNKGTLQYEVLEYFLNEFKNKKPDAVIYAGDVTCDGEKEVYLNFLEQVKAINIPFFYIPGNSDLRKEKYSHEIKKISSPLINEVKGEKIIAINDCEGYIPEGVTEKIISEKSDLIIFMHHPLKDEKLIKRLKENPDSALFYAHIHKFERVGNIISLPCLDPDKSVGLPPSVIYYNTLTKETELSSFDCPVPEGFNEYFGISCYKIEEQIEFAIENKLKNLELRPNIIGYDIEKLEALIKKWRVFGGENLSLHLPDISFDENKVLPDKNFDKYLCLAKELKAKRLTQHVPMVTLSKIKENPCALEMIASFLAGKFNDLNWDITVGVENMHMTDKDRETSDRRFGYTPEECIEFMKLLQSKCRHNIGINFDIGHARNNAPISQSYQISTWLSLIGKYTVGYHIHQVELTDKFDNHRAIKDIYGHLISYASFFKYWENDKINRVPLIFEMRGEDDYKITLETFKKVK